ncbi:MAG: hypothetical protein LKK00_09010, partial [Intestinimonas sp.]|nr:hypothetical protein [Intestinimonas sp.]
MELLTPLPQGEGRARPGYLIVEEIIREYPALLAESHELRYAFRTSGSNDPTASAAMRELPPEGKRRLDAIRQTIRKTHYMENGLLRLNLINMVYWKKTHTLTQAAMELSCTEQQAELYRNEFIRSVKESLGITDCEGCKYYRSIYQKVKGCCYCRDNYQMRIRDAAGC